MMINSFVMANNRNPPCGWICRLPLLGSANHGSRLWYPRGLGYYCCSVFPHLAQIFTLLLSNFSPSRQRDLQSFRSKTQTSAMRPQFQTQAMMAATPSEVPMTFVTSTSQDEVHVFVPETFGPGLVQTVANNFRYVIPHLHRNETNFAAAWYSNLCTSFTTTTERSFGWFRTNWPSRMIPPATGSFGSLVVCISAQTSPAKRI